MAKLYRQPIQYHGNIEFLSQKIMYRGIGIARPGQPHNSTCLARIAQEVQDKYYGGSMKASRRQHIGQNTGTTGRPVIVSAFILKRK
jgi:hypothetical protein